jgi:tetratricopeptide (TPR) repeat protein
METEESQAEKICTYFENIAEAYVLDQDFIQAEQYVEKSLYYAEKYNLEYRKAKNLYLRGIIFMSRNEKTIAQQFFLSANVIFIKNNNYEETVRTFVNLGKITKDLKAYFSACSYFQQAEKVYLAHDIGNDFMIGEIYYCIAYVYLKMDNIDNAIKYSFLAKEKFDQLESRKEYGKTLLLLAEEYKKKGDLDRAIKYSEKTLEVFEEIYDYYYLAIIENNLGKLFYEFDNMEESFIHYNKAKEIRINHKDNRIVDTLIDICKNYIKLKEVDKAQQMLDEIMDNIDDGNDKALIDYYHLKYRVDMLKCDEKSAENTLLMALDFVRNMGFDKEQAEISIMIGKFYIDRGQEKEAAGYLNMGVDTFKKLGIIKES